MSTQQVAFGMGLPLRPPRGSAVRLGPRRRPRHAPTKRATPGRSVFMVFLPPGGYPQEPEDDEGYADPDDDFVDPGQDDVEDEPDQPPSSDSYSDITPSESPSQRSSSSAGWSKPSDAATPIPLMDDVDSLFSDDPTYSSWLSQNKRRSVPTISNFGVETDLGAEQLNESLAPSHTERLRHVIEPDRAYGAIFTFEVVFANARELPLRVWTQVASEMDLRPPPDMEDILRAESMPPELAVQRVFFWDSDWGRMKEIAFRAMEIERQILEDGAFDFTPSPGINDWLASMKKYNIACALATQLPRRTVEKIMKKAGMDERAFEAIVSVDDELETKEQTFLMGAYKLVRAPERCAVFTDKPKDVTAAHEVLTKVVGFLGAHKAYEMRNADATLTDFEDLTVYNIRRLFASLGVEILEPELEPERPDGSGSGNDNSGFRGGVPRPRW